MYTACSTSACIFHAGLGGDNSGTFPHYETIPDLPHSCETIPEATSHHYDYISNDIYSKGEPEDLAKYKWYHGKVTTDQADAALSFGLSNIFFV